MCYLCTLILNVAILSEIFVKQYGTHKYKKVCILSKFRN